MQRAELAALQWRSIRDAHLVEVAQPGSFDQILRMAEQVDDRHDADAGTGRGPDEAGELFLRIGIAPRHAGQAGKFHGVLEVEVKFLVTPFRVARQPLQQKIQPLNLAGEVPLKSAAHGLLSLRPCVHFQPRVCAMSCSSFTMSAEKTRMPSEVFSVAMASSLSAKRKDFSSNVTFLKSAALAVSGSSLRTTGSFEALSSWRSGGAMVSRSQPASSRISSLLRKLAPMTSVL